MQVNGEMFSQIFAILPEFRLMSYVIPASYTRVLEIIILQTNRPRSKQVGKKNEKTRTRKLYEAAAVM